MAKEIQITQDIIFFFRVWWSDAGNTFESNEIGWSYQTPSDSENADHARKEAKAKI
jgi:hypothetical protein